MNKNSKNIILISTGNFQEYILDNIEQLLLLKLNIHIIIDKTFFDYVKHYESHITIIFTESLNINYFDKNTKLISKFRNNFLNNCSKRLFLLYEYMKKENIINVIHLENDVLLYNNMDYNFQKKIYITMDSKNRCIPGIVYIPNYTLLEILIKKYNFEKNDMINMALFYHSEKENNVITTFPIIDNTIETNIYNQNFQEFNSIFDGASIGQYLGGVDPRNIDGDTRGFVNETCEIKYDNYIFKWIKKDKYYIPHIEINHNLIPINNLHIHSKHLKNFNPFQI